MIAQPYVKIKKSQGYCGNLDTINNVFRSATVLYLSVKVLSHKTILKSLFLCFLAQDYHSVVQNSRSNWNDKEVMV